MRHRFLALVTAGVLVLSSLVLGTYAAQADDTQATVSISGTLTLPDGYALATGDAGTVYALEVVETADGLSSRSNTSGQLSSDGSYSISGLVPGSSYIIWTSPSDIHLSQGNQSNLVTVANGGFATGTSPFDLSGSDLSSLALTVITPTADVSGVDLAMPLGARIAGTVYLPDGTPTTFNNFASAVICTSESNYNAGKNGSNSSDSVYGYTSLDGSGSYSCLVAPGQAYVVRVSMSGYPTVWRGGFVGATPTLPDANVMVITAPAGGETMSGQDITLVAGSSISGKITGPNPYATACVLHTDGSQTDCQRSLSIDGDGHYTIAGLLPGASYGVYGSASEGTDGNFYGYMDTWYGGFVGESPLPSNTGVTLVTSAASGQNVPGIDITPVKPVTITGSILPSSVVSGSNGVTVIACPAYIQDGKQYYRTNAAHGTVTPNSGDLDVDRFCQSWWVSPSETSYSMNVNPGVDYVVVAQTNGYADAWSGGYVGDSGVTLNAYSYDNGFVSNVAMNGTPVADRLLPSTTKIQVVSGTQGQTIGGVDLRFGPVVTWTVTFVDGQGTTLATRTSIDGGSVTAPADPTRDGYVFNGWDTSFDNVTSNLTVTATWEPTPEAEVVKEEAIAQTTGGLARLANGTDAYTLITTLTGGDGAPMPGLAGHLTAVTPANVTVSLFTDNGDGTYNVEVRASVPGNYEVRVLLDGVQVGSPIPVNFIGADIAEPVRVLGDQQAADGLGFLPGEKVDVVVHSDPINIGRRTADAQGRVPVTFQVPKDFDLGRHTVTFTGVTSGTATVTFSVATPTAGSSQVKGETGGTVVTARNNGSLLVLAGMLVVAGLAVHRLRTRTVKRG